MSVSKGVIKAVACSLAFVLVFALFSSVFISASDRKENFESAISLSAKFKLYIPDNTNYIFCGASHCAMSIIPDDIDKMLGVNSYNLSVQASKLYSRYEMLKNILNRFPIETVVLEISYDCLSLDETTSRRGDLSVFQLYREYLSPSYILTHPIILEDLFNITQDRFHATMADGWIHVFRYLTGRERVLNFKDIDKQKAENRGYESFPAEFTDQHLQESEYVDIESVPETFLPRNVDTLKKCVDLCREHQVDVLFMVTPVSDSFIKSHCGWDIFHQNLMALAEECNCVLIDFNLIKKRSELFQDGSCFYNEAHMSIDGARVFSKLFSETMISLKDDPDWDKQFFSTYSEMIDSAL